MAKKKAADDDEVTGEATEVLVTEEPAEGELKPGEATAKREAEIAAEKEAAAERALAVGEGGKEGEKTPLDDIRAILVNPQASERTKMIQLGEYFEKFDAKRKEAEGEGGEGDDAEA